MRTTARPLTGFAVATASLGLSAVSATSAFAGDHERLELSPATARPGATVSVHTTACGRDGHGRGEGWAAGIPEFRVDPATHREVVIGQFRIPDDAGPGSHSIHVRCDNGQKVTAGLVIEHHGGPTGHVKTGVGGSVGPDTTQIAAGVAVLATAAVGGSRLLRRRASGAQGS